MTAIPSNLTRADLLEMALSSLTQEKVDKLLSQRDDKERELSALLDKRPSDLWLADLEAFEAQWDKELENDRTTRPGVKGPARAAPKKKAAKAAAYSDDEDSDVR